MIESGCLSSEAFSVLLLSRDIRWKYDESDTLIDFIEISCEMLKDGHDFSKQLWRLFALLQS